MKFVATTVMVLCAQLAAFAEGLLLREGESHVFEFTSLPYVRPATQADSGSFSVTFAEGTFLQGERLRLELYTNSLSEPPLSHTFSGLPGPVGQMTVSKIWASHSPAFWPELHGLARVTMLSGNADIVRFTVKQIVNGDVYSRSFTLPDLRPKLLISAINNELLQISWPTNSTGYNLEIATNTTTPIWYSVTNSVTNVAGNFSVIVDKKLSYSLFRLRRS